MTPRAVPSLAELVGRFGRAQRPDVAVERRRPDGMDDATVAAVGKLSAALEVAEDARGHLYAFHRLSGRADLDLQEAVQALRESGHAELADAVHTVLVGRGVIGDRWTYELIEDYDDGYLAAFREADRIVREVTGAPRHLAEAEMQAREQRREQ